MKFNNQQDIEKFYDLFGSSHFQLQSKTLHEFGKSYLDIYYKSISFVIQVLAVVGIIAGFGFTAYSFIQSRFLFFVGEGILLYTIIYGIIWVQKVYMGEFKSVRVVMDKYLDYFKKRNAQFNKLYNGLVNNNEINDDEFKELLKIDNQALIDLNPDPLPDINKTQIYPKNLFYLLIIGSALLLISFVFFSIIHFIFFIIL